MTKKKKNIAPIPSDDVEQFAKYSNDVDTRPRQAPLKSKSS